MITDSIRGELVAFGSSRNIAGYAEMFLMGYKPRTREVYRQGIDQWLDFCAEHGIDPLDTRRTALDAWRRQLEELGRKPATVANRLGAVAMFYRWMSEEELVERNPAAHLKRPRVDQESMTRSLSRDEAMRLVWAAEASGRPSEMALVTMLAHLGLRVSEALGVRIEDLGEERGHRTVRIVGKGEKPALMPMPPAVARAVEVARAGRDTGHLILDTRGNPMNRHSAHFVVAKLARKAGISGQVHPHCLRHAAITCALDAGVPLRDVQHMARHSDPRTTSRYDHGRLSLDRHAVYTLSAYLAGGG